MKDFPSRERLLACARRLAEHFCRLVELGLKAEVEIVATMAMKSKTANKLWTP
jgi:hypothetical protein